MCGIVGKASGAAITDLHLLEVQRDSLHHRGPDDCGLWSTADRCVALGHRRLAIIDLSPGGHQPMADPRGELCIVFNGEIYNFRELRTELEGQGHVFRSRSDTEVILAAYREWDLDCVQHLNGMFAFALYDTRCRRLFLARDRAGEKPLFYRLSNGALSFASELKALMADPTLMRRIDPESLDCYLSFGYIPGDRCILSGVNKLPAGHMLTFEPDRGRCQIRRYWRLPAPPGSGSGNAAPKPSELVEELESLLEDAVRRQLIADVPVGILLSGGVDSSLTTAMAVRAAAQVKTFTIRFPGSARLDETEHARLIACHFGTSHTELVAEPSTVVLMPLLARQFDEPVVDSSMIPTFLVSRLVRQGCTVALGGDGGDELFGGYRHYSRWLRLQQQAGWLPVAWRGALAQLAGGLLPVGTRGRTRLQELGTDFRAGLPLSATGFDRKMRQRLLPRELWPEHAGSVRAETVQRSRIPGGVNLLDRATRMDFQNYLVEDILVKVDRASMLNSLEVRAPWLDYRIIEFAFARVPPHLKASGTSRKILPKQLCRKLLPSGFDIHRKQGFNLPLASWLRSGDWGDYFRQVLLDARDTWFDRGCLAGLLDAQQKGRSNSERLFALVLFELWRREYRVSF